MNIFNRNNKTLTPWSAIQMKGEKEATINISGYIGVPEWWQFDPEMEKDIVSTKEKMQSELKEISSLKAETIKVNIDSPGGDVNHGQAIYSALSNNPARIEVEYTGFSASIATIIAAAATDNEISMSHTNMILIHEARGCVYGTARILKQHADIIDKINDTMSGIYARQMGTTKEDALAQMGVNNGDGEWLTAYEAQELGLVKHVTEPMKAAASVDHLSNFGYSIPKDKILMLKNMKFKKTDQPIQTMSLENGKVLLYEGDELKEGTALQMAGEAPDFKLEGTHETADGQVMTVDADNKLVKIEAKASDDASGDLNDSVLEKVAEMLTALEVKFEEKLNALRGKGSNGKPPQGDNFQNTQTDLGTQATSRMAMSAKLEEIQAKKRKKAGLD